MARVASILGTLPVRRRARRRHSSLTFWIIQAVSGLSFGMLLFLLAAGLSLVFGLMGVINLAHGSFYLLGAYVALTAMRTLDNFLLALLAGGLAITLLGLVMERYFLHRFLRNELAQVLLTFGFFFLFGDIALLVTAFYDLYVLFAWLV